MTNIHKCWRDDCKIHNKSEEKTMNEFYYQGISGPAYDLKELHQKLELIVKELDVIINRMNDDLELAHYIPGISREKQ